MDPSIDEAIEEVQKSQGRRWEIGDERAQKLKEMLRVAYFVLKERLVQPWPPLLVKLLDEAGELSTYLQPSFIELLKLHFGELIKSPFTANSSVLFWQKDEMRWDVGRILAINPTKIVYKEQVIEDLEPKHVLSHTTAGGRCGTRTQDRASIKRRAVCRSSPSIAPRCNSSFECRHCWQVWACCCSMQHGKGKHSS